MLFYSLIKAPDGTYRYNSEIYKDAQNALSLMPDCQTSLPYLLMEIMHEEVLEVLEPHTSYIRAVLENPQIASAIKRLPQDLISDIHRLGLIGSLAVDPSTYVRDIDLVFSGPISWLDKTCEWFISEDDGGPPLRRHLPDSLPTICGFFAAAPTPYLGLKELQIIEERLMPYRVKIISTVTPKYLNIQVYNIETIPKTRQSQLVIRDTLARQALREGVEIDVRGYRATVGDVEAIFITDVEKQMFGVALHGGNTECD